MIHSYAILEQESAVLEQERKRFTCALEVSLRIVNLIVFLQAFHTYRLLSIQAKNTLISNAPVRHCILYILWIGIKLYLTCVLLPKL